MLLCVFYVGSLLGSYRFQAWDIGFIQFKGFLVSIVLAVMFITKIPLPPFHVWLPIVHAEASSPVSMCLSGYIMKLGLLGVLRFCYGLLSDYIFSSVYVMVGLGISLLFFMSACRELDGKRWLAFLRLSHIVVVAVCFRVCSFEGVLLSLVYSLGHGLSAGVVFLLLWMIYEVSGRRNWLVLKGCVSRSLLIRCLLVVCICTTASIPPTLNFFSEIVILCEGGYMYGGLCVILLSLYLFAGGLVPVFLVGCLLSRHYSIGFGCGYVNSYVGGLVLLGV